MSLERAAGGYLRRVIAKNEKFEIIACEWTEGNASALHGHGRSDCWVLVEEGRFENILEMGGTSQAAGHTAGEVISTPVGARHSIRCLSGVGKTLHVYSPPLGATTTDSQLAPDALQLQSSGIDWKDLERLVDTVRSASLPTHSPYFMNQLFSGIHPEAVLAQKLAAETRTTLATLEASPVFSKVEAEVVSALCGKIGWNSNQSGGVAVPGGSAANFMALHLARHRRWPELKQLGMQAAPAFVVFVSDQAHYSLKKAAAVLGFGMNSLISVSSDEQGRMSPAALSEAIAEQKAMGKVPLAVVATAGTTVFGAFDPIDSIAEICGRDQIWLHVDAAWGGPALFTDRLKRCMVGIERADSLTFDAHKLFGSSLTSSFFLTRHASLLIEANDVSGADYLFHGELDRGRLSWQCGRGPDALGLWMLWKSRGERGMAALVDRLLDVRDQVIPWIDSQPRLEWVARPDYLNVCVKVRPPSGLESASKDWAIQVRDRLKLDERAWINFSRTSDGTAFLRLVLVHPEIQLKEVQEMLSWALEVGNQ